jgi:hypothetical protein
MDYCHKILHLFTEILICLLRKNPKIPLAKRERLI